MVGAQGLLAPLPWPALAGTPARSAEAARWPDAAVGLGAARLPLPPQVMGDLNTMANGVARLSPHYCCDALRWRTLGWSEAQWWHHHIFSVEGAQAAARGQAAAAAARAAAHAQAACRHRVPRCLPPSALTPSNLLRRLCGPSPPAESPDVPHHEQANPHLLRLGLPHEVARDALNPGLFDPFCPTNDVTLDNPAYRVLGLSLMTGKLDWVLVPRGRVEVVGKAMGNHSYSLSDHKWLMVEVRLL